MLNGLLTVETIRRISNVGPSLMRSAWGDGVAEVDCSDNDGLPSSSNSSSITSTTTISATARHCVLHLRWDTEYPFVLLYFVSRRYMVSPTDTEQWQPSAVFRENAKGTVNPERHKSDKFTR